MVLVVSSLNHFKVPFIVQSGCVRPPRRPSHSLVWKQGSRRTEKRKRLGLRWHSCLPDQAGWCCTVSEDGLSAHGLTGRLCGCWFVWQAEEAKEHCRACVNDVAVKKVDLAKAKRQILTQVRELVFQCDLTLKAVSSFKVHAHTHTKQSHIHTYRHSCVQTPSYTHSVTIISHIFFSVNTWSNCQLCQ